MKTVRVRTDSGEQNQPVWQSAGCRRPRWGARTRTRPPLRRQSGLLGGPVRAWRLAFGVDAERSAAGSGSSCARSSSSRALCWTGPVASVPSGWAEVAPGACPLVGRAVEPLQRRCAGLAAAGRLEPCGALGRRAGGLRATGALCPVAGSAARPGAPAGHVPAGDRPSCSIAGLDRRRCRPWLECCSGGSRTSVAPSPGDSVAEGPDSGWGQPGIARACKVGRTLPWGLSTGTGAAGAAQCD